MGNPMLPLLQSAHVAARLAMPTQQARPAAAPAATLRWLPCRLAAACCAPAPKEVAPPGCYTRTKIPNHPAAVAPPNVRSAQPSAGRPDTGHVVRLLDPRKFADSSASH